MLWVSEGLGRLLWASETPWLVFAGAMMATVSHGLAVGLLARWILRRFVAE